MAKGALDRQAYSLDPQTPSCLRPWAELVIGDGDLIPILLPIPSTAWHVHLHLHSPQTHPQAHSHSIYAYSPNPHIPSCPRTRTNTLYYTLRPECSSLCTCMLSLTHTQSHARYPVTSVLGLPMLSYTFTHKLPTRTASDSCPALWSPGTRTASDSCPGPSGVLAQRDVW